MTPIEWLPLVEMTHIVLLAIIAYNLHYLRLELGAIARKLGATTASTPEDPSYDDEADD